MKTKIYHNPRCKKSREGLQLLEERNIDFEVIKYLENVPSINELEKLIQMLNIHPIDLIRKNEKIWKESYKPKDLSDSEIIYAMHTNPKLIERPIVVKGDKAVIGRPIDNILEFIK